MTEMHKDEITCSADAGPVAALSLVDRLEVELVPPADPEDFPLCKACDLSGESGCESCQ